MKLSSRTTFCFLLVAATMLFVGLGCSHESSLEPAGASLSTGLQTSLTGPSATVTQTVTFVEPFDNNVNEGDWSYYTTTGATIEQDGGNPGGYLHDDNVQSFAPHPGTGLGVQSIFTGDYKARNVTSLGIDLRSFYYDLNISTRYLSLFIMNDNGTPYDASDDWGAYIIGPTKVPEKYVLWKLVAETTNEPGWICYDFPIDAQSRRFPDGWTYWTNAIDGGKKPGGWSDLMQNVSYVQFYYGDPEMIYLIDTYDLGLDNPRITREETL